MIISVKEAVDRTLDALGLRSRAYYRVFRSPDGAEVLRDLAPFCRAFTPCWGATPEDTARLIGRNEVWHRIAEYLSLSPQELYELRGGKYPIEQRIEDEDE